MSAPVLGVRFDELTVNQAADRALALLAARKDAYVCTPNPEIVWRCRKDKALAAAIAGADMTLADGVGIVWAARTLGCPLPERVSGYDFLLALLARFHGRVFLLGGKPGVADEAAETIGRQFPAVTVCGCLDGYFTDDGPVVEAIRASGAELVLACLGSPKQELWMARNRGRLCGSLAIGLGGCLDVLSGRKRRAPERWIRLKLEWLYRLIHEPSRLVRQLCLPLFVLAVLGERIKKAGLK